MQLQERPVVDGAQHFMNVRHITLRGTNFEIGKKLAEIAQERHGATPQTFLTADFVFTWSRPRMKTEPGRSCAASTCALLSMVRHSADLVL